jgi:hypothetical protein
MAEWLILLAFPAPNTTAFWDSHDHGLFTCSRRSATVMIYPATAFGISD